MTVATPFRFDRERHVYIDALTGEELPHATGMLNVTGWIDDTWFTEESSDRGTAVHQLTADYDLGALPDDTATITSRWKGYLQAYEKAKAVLGVTVEAVEEPLVHPVYRYGVRPDRRVVYRGMRGVLEIKSGVRSSPKRSPLGTGHVTTSHCVQTALQAMAVAEHDAVTVSWALARLCVYVKPNGKFAVDVHEDRRDFDEAMAVIRRIREVLA